MKMPVKILFIQNQLCARGWKEAKVLTEAGVDIDLLELGKPSEFMDYSIFKDSHNIPVGADIGSMIRNRKRIKTEIRDFAAGRDYDIAHVHNEPDNLGVWTKKNLPIPVVHDIHDLVSLKPITWARGPKKWFVRSLVNRWEGYVCRKADGIMSTSSLMIEHIWKRYGTKNIGYVENKPLKEKFELAEKIDDGKVHFVYPGGISLDPGGSRYLWSMFESICAMGFNVHLYPPVFEPGRQEIIRKRCSGVSGLHYHLPVAQNKVIREISKYHYGLVLFSSFTKNILMATSNRVYEYQIAGIPVITNDIGHIGDYVKKKKCGEVIGDPGEIKKLISGGREYNLDTNDCFMDAKPILDLYSKIIA